MTTTGKILWPGAAQGEALVLTAPISFWGGIDPQSSKVTLAGHPQHGQAIAGKVLIIPELIGSSSSSAIMLELIYKNIAPAALLLGGHDAILPIGVVVAAQMGWKTLPMILLETPNYSTGANLRVTNDGQIIRL